MDPPEKSTMSGTSVAVVGVCVAVGAVLLALVVALAIRQTRHWSTRYQEEHDARVMDRTPVTTTSCQDAVSVLNNGFSFSDQTSTISVT